MNVETRYKVRAITRGRKLPRLKHATAAKRAIDAAVFAAELTALCGRERGVERGTLALRALRVVREPTLYAAIERGILLGDAQCALDPAHDADPLTRTLALCAWAFVSAGDALPHALMAVISAGGDSESAGGIVAGWVDVLHRPREGNGVTRAA